MPRERITKEELWEAASAYAADAEKHFSKALEIIEAGGFEGDDIGSYRAMMALMHSFQVAHTCIENALLRVLEAIDEAPPMGELVHYDLITRVTGPLDALWRNIDDVDGGDRPAILEGDVAKAAKASACLRNVAALNFGSIDNFTSDAAIDAARTLSQSLRSAIERFQQLSLVFRLKC